MKPASCEIVHLHGCADGLLVVHQGLVEAAGGAVSQDAGEHVERGVVRVGSGGT